MTFVVCNAIKQSSRAQRCTTYFHVYFAKFIWFLLCTARKGCRARKMHFVCICPNFHFWLHCEVLLNSFFLNFFSKLYYDVNCRKKVTISQAQGYTLFSINFHTFDHLFKIGRNIAIAISFKCVNIFQEFINIVHTTIAAHSNAIL